MEEDKEKKAEGYTPLLHKFMDTKMPPWERLMMIFLLDCENRFNKFGDWFSLTDEDFIEKMGFGKDKVVLRKTRNSLIERGWISFKRGIAGKKSSYKLNRKKKT